MQLTEAFIFDRDNRAYEMRKAGATYRQIAKTLNISESTAHAAVKRALSRISSRFALDHQAELSLEIERLDDLMRQLWPLTRPQEIETGNLNADGSPETTRIPPSLDAINTVLKIAQQRSKLLGLDTIKLTIDGSGGPAAPELGPVKKNAEITPREEALDLMKELVKNGVLDQVIGEQILAKVDRDSMPADIVDAEVVEDHAPLEIEAAEEVDNEPPPWMGDDDDDNIPPPWRPS